MRIHQYIQMYLRRYMTRSLEGKFRMGVGLGLLLLGATVLGHVPGASAHTATPYSGSDRTYSIVVESHTLAPQSAKSSGVVAMIQQAFGSYGSGAIRVANCESGLNPDAYNPSGAAGLFQIMPGTWAGTAQAGQSRYNASANIAAAHQIFVRDGYSWQEWTCKP